MDKCSEKDCVDFDVSKEDSELTGDCDICSRNKQNPYMDAASDQYFQMKAKFANPTDDVPIEESAIDIDPEVLKTFSPYVEETAEISDAVYETLKPGPLSAGFAPNGAMLKQCSDDPLLKDIKDSGERTKWKVIADFPEYEVSTGGQIRRLKTGKILKPFLSKWGYQMIDFSIKGQRTRKTVHRIVAETFLGPNDLPVNHKDGIKMHNGVINLEFITTAENNQHAYDAGLRIAPNSSLLTTEDVLDILERVRSGEKQKEVAFDYKISPQAVCDMLHGRTWSEVTGINNASKCNTGIETKKENFDTFVQLIRNQFWHGGEKYKLSETKEFTDAICEVFPGASGVDWVLGTCMKYLGRYKNFGREKDLLKIATYMYLLWLKGNHFQKNTHDEDVKRGG